MIGVLPFFHAFGFTATLWLPLVNGFGVAYHPNPMDAKTIGDIAAKYRGTIIISTPTFYSSYIRKIAARAVRAPALRGRRRRKAAAADRRGVQGTVRDRSHRGLRLHGDVTGRCRQHARAAARVGRPADPGRQRARRRSGNRRGAARRRGRDAAGQRTEPDDRLSRRSRPDRGGLPRRVVRRPATSRRSTPTASSASPTGCRGSARSPARWCRT